MNDTQIIQFHKSDTTTKFIKYSGIFSLLLFIAIALFAYTYTYSITIPCILENNLSAEGREFSATVTIENLYSSRYKIGDNLTFYAKCKDAPNIVFTGIIKNITPFHENNLSVIEIEARIPERFSVRFPLILSKIKLLVEKKSIASIIMAKK